MPRRTTLHTSTDVLPFHMPARFFYKLNAAGEPVPCEDPQAVKVWLQELDRSVAFDRVGTVRVTTVFAGHAWETAVCTEDSVTVVRNYPTLTAALQGHDAVVEEVADQQAGTDTAGKSGRS